MSAARKVLRTVVLALLFAFLFGFGIGTWLRCRMEKPPTYIGATPAIERAG
jgi:TRAP-type C4-dicarboxylate transport system permease small subunit